jgi:hypothetical protein
MFHQELMPPPPMAKTHLYAKLNLQRSAVILSFLLTVLINLRKLFMSPAFTSALIGVGLFTLGLFMTNSESDKIAKSNVKSDAKQTNQIIQSKPEIPSSIPTVTSSAGSNLVSESRINRVKSSKSDSEKLINRNDDKNEQNVVSKSLQVNQVHQAPEIQTQAVILIPSEINESYFTRNEILALRNNFRKNFLSSFGYEISNILERISLSINKTTSVSTLNTGLQPLSSPLLNNYSIALTYTMDKHNSIAAELGQENFSQKYHGVINGFDADIKQVYTAQWYGLSYQYNFGEMESFYTLNPFLKAMVSATSIGPFMKGSIGISYNLTDKISLQGALEASRLAYSFQNKWFATDKYGFIYGLKIGF